MHRRTVHHIKHWYYIEMWRVWYESLIRPHTISGLSLGAVESWSNAIRILVWKLSQNMLWEIPTLPRSLAKTSQRQSNPHLKILGSFPSYSPWFAWNSPFKICDLQGLEDKSGNSQMEVALCWLVAYQKSLNLSERSTTPTMVWPWFDVIWLTSPQLLWAIRTLYIQEP